ncbi:hypothetical protein [uncultured Psychrobacter sp.]|uniref:hypothetical protein n=1 Tax=uncultured Psychrobacter sp. TaxID=259303 RepID=UPI00261227D9|nr:hypothetical protein [uncultured Psychrobacter sp.]
MTLPNDIDILKNKIQKILNPIDCAVEKGTKADKDFLFKAVRADVGDDLPPYYLIYFLFVDLLGFKNLGRFEKVAWSIPIDYNGVAYVLEHRKLGMGLFVADKESQKKECQEIVRKINNAVKVAKPYFDWVANEAAKDSQLNVLNHSLKLYDRYTFLIEEYKRKEQESISHNNTVQESWNFENYFSVYSDSQKLKKEKQWLALSAIDAFYSFTEHIFIHAAILKGSLLTGEDVERLAQDDWANKFKACLDVQNKLIRPHYDKLGLIKKQVRNYMAHGAFGKNGEAFQIHSKVGAVPLLMTNQKSGSRFSIQPDTEFEEKEAIKAIENFIHFYWNSDDFLEIIYIKSTLPSILTFANDSTYEDALKSLNNMEDLIDDLNTISDNSANMDW